MQLNKYTCFTLMLFFFIGCDEIHLKVPSREPPSSSESTTIFDASTTEAFPEEFVEQIEKRIIPEQNSIETDNPEDAVYQEPAFERIPEKRPDDGSWAKKTTALRGSSNRLVVDSASNVYQAGDFIGSVTIEKKVYPSQNNNRLMLTKWNKIGKWIWTTILTSTKSIRVNDILIDEGRKQLLLTGTFQGTILLGKTKWSSENYRSSYIVGMNLQGKILWAQLLKSTKEIISENLTSGPKGSLLVSGHFSGKVQLGTVSLDAKKGEGLFILNLGKDNKWKWGAQAHMPNGSSHHLSSKGLISKPGKHIIVLVSFQRDMTVGKIKLSTEDGHIWQFLAGLDHTGNWLWAKKIGIRGELQVNALASSNTGKLYATGWFSKEKRFGKTLLHPEAQGNTNHIFVAELDWNGEWLWANYAGSPTAIENSHDLAIDPQENLLVTGIFRDKSHFGHIPLVPGVRTDVFVACLSPKGKWLWAKKATSQNDVISANIVSDREGRVIIDGIFWENVTLEGIKLQGPANANTLFIWKLPRNPGKTP